MDKNKGLFDTLRSETGADKIKPIFFRVYFQDPFSEFPNSEEVRIQEIEVSLNISEIAYEDNYEEIYKQIISKARQQSKLTDEKTYPFISIEKFDPMSEKERQRQREKDLPHLFKKECKH